MMVPMRVKRELFLSVVLVVSYKSSILIVSYKSSKLSIDTHDMNFVHPFGKRSSREGNEDRSVERG